MNDMNGYPWIDKRISELNLKQKDVAVYCGLSASALNKLILGTEKRRMLAIEALKLSEVLQIPIREVITGEKEISIRQEFQEIKDLIKRGQIREFNKIVQDELRDPTNQPVDPKTNS